MQIVWFAPGVGRGKATRAASVCRHMDDVVVFRDSAENNDLLDVEGVPWMVVPVSEMVSVAAGQPIVVDADLSGFPTLGHRFTTFHRFDRSLTDCLFTVEDVNFPLPSLFPLVYRSPSVVRDPTDRDPVVLVVESVASEDLPDPPVDPVWWRGCELEVSPVAHDELVDRLGEVWGVWGPAGANLWAEVAAAQVPAPRWWSAMPDQRSRVNFSLNRTPTVVDADRQAARMISDLLNPHTSR